MQLRDHVYLGITQSLCPICLELVPAKIIARDGRVYFRKRCSRHGVREDFVCSDVRWYDRLEFSTPGKLPVIQGVQPEKGCPFDCGLCTEHEQHTCVALMELTSHCNLTCPMCFASSAPGGKHLALADCLAMIDRLVAAEGKPEVLQLSGGEPTLHPQFIEILEYACAQPIDVVMINTNGIRLAKDRAFLNSVARWRHRCEVYLQFDGVTEDPNQALRGEALLETRREAVASLSQAGVNMTLVMTLQPRVNEDQIGDVVRFALEHPHVTGVSFQPATYTGRYFADRLEERITFPDVIDALVRQAGDLFRPDDFLPLPCAHPNGHSLSYVYRDDGHAVPLNRFIALEQNMDLLANGIVFDRKRARALIETYLGREASQTRFPLPVEASCSSGSGGCQPEWNVPASIQRRMAGEDAAVSEAASSFFGRAMEGTLRQQDVLRITITSFMDAYNFDVRQLMKSCVHHVLPSGHIIPFSAYNVLYRDGHVPLPSLSDVASQGSASRSDVVPGRDESMVAR